jgi:hypothetical protein
LKIFGMCILRSRRSRKQAEIKACGVRGVRRTSVRRSDEEVA